MKVPMREKYVDEAVGIWMVFGEYPGGNLSVCTDTKEIFHGGLPPDKAALVVEAQETFRKTLYAILC